MTYENCLKYRDEATDIETKLFWAERITRKYPEQAVVKEEKVVEKPSKAKKKVVKQ